jgi:hypothetical protein
MIQLPRDSSDKKLQLLKKEKRIEKITHKIEFPCFPIEKINPSQDQITQSSQINHFLKPREEKTFPC